MIKKGDKAHLRGFGPGTVVAIYPDHIFEISVRFDSGQTDSFTKEEFYDLLIGDSATPIPEDTL